MSKKKDDKYLPDMIDRFDTIGSRSTGFTSDSSYGSAVRFSLESGFSYLQDKTIDPPKKVTRWSKPICKPMNPKLYKYRNIVSTYRYEGPIKAVGHGLVEEGFPNTYIGVELTATSDELCRRLDSDNIYVPDEVEQAFAPLAPLIKDAGTDQGCIEVSTKPLSSFQQLLTVFRGFKKYAKRNKLSKDCQLSSGGGCHFHVSNNVDPVSNLALLELNTQITFLAMLLNDPCDTDNMWFLRGGMDDFIKILKASRKTQFNVTESIIPQLLGKGFSPPIALRDNTIEFRFLGSTLCEKELRLYYDLVIAILKYLERDFRYNEDYYNTITKRYNKLHAIKRIPSKKFVVQEIRNFLTMIGVDPEPYLKTFMYRLDERYSYKDKELFEIL